MNNPILAQLTQFIDGPVHDGNVIGKSYRDELFKLNYIERTNGFNFLSKKGVQICVELKILKS